MQWILPILAPLHQAPNLTIPTVTDLILHCPRSEELTKVANLPGHQNALQFKYKDEKTSLTWHVWRNAPGPYKFKGVDIVESFNAPFIVAHYTNIQGEGIIHLTLSKLELNSNRIVSCKGDPKFLTMEFKNENMHQYRTRTGIATDIAITCTIK